MVCFLLPHDTGWGSLGQTSLHGDLAGAADVCWLFGLAGVWNKCSAFCSSLPDSLAWWGRNPCVRFPQTTYPKVAASPKPLPDRLGWRPTCFFGQWLHSSRSLHWLHHKKQAEGKLKTKSFPQSVSLKERISALQPACLSFPILCFLFGFLNLFYI